MIGSLRGKILLKDGLNVIVDVNGVGYRVLISEKQMLKTLMDQEVMFYIYSHIREDAFDLFGFSELADLKLFENLIGVSGVGPKTAMSIFSFLTREEIVNAVLKGDAGAFTGIPRLGNKNAQKIIIELKNKLGDTSIIDLNELGGSTNDEVFEALKGFGFSAKEISDALKNIDKNATTIEEKIKLSIKYLGK